MTQRIDHDQELEEIIARRPRPLYETRLRGWWRNNWMAFVMCLAVVISQIWNGTDWLHARESNEAVTKADIQRLEAALREIPNTYVRQDVFTQVLVQIRDRLANLDAKKESGR